MRTLLLGFVLFLGLLVALPTVSHAAKTYMDDGAVLLAGSMQEGDAATFKVVLKISFPAAGGGTTIKFYQAVAGREKESLSVALAAQSTGKKVRIRTDLQVGLGDPTKVAGSELNPRALYGIMLVY
ncbi:MAG: hypothetical protein WAW37_07095 [Syntrophobacteraceae bacterium]